MMDLQELFEASPAPEVKLENDALYTPTLLTPTAAEDGYSLMEQLLNHPSSRLRRLQYGEVVEGTVMYKDRDELLVDIGLKSEGIVPNRELQTLSSQELQEIKIGENVLVFVVLPENQEGQAVLSIDKARREKSWLQLQAQFEAGGLVEAQVSGINKGGLLVTLEGINGFVPTSQISRLGTISEADRQTEMTRLLNTSLLLKIIEVDRNRNRLILSERQAAQERRGVQREHLLTELEVGQVREGVVTNLCNFGAFVDIGGVDGLVFLNELSWNRVAHPSEVLQLGQVVKVQVTRIDEDGKKIALSLKRLQPEPWQQITETYQPGQLVEVTISQVANFGAFARLNEGMEGLIHISELSQEQVAHPGDVVKPGDVVTVRILTLDSQRRRIALSLKQAAPDYENNQAEVKAEVE